MSAEELRDRGRIALRRGEFDEALAQFQAMLSVDPDNPDIHGDLGKTYLSEGRLKEARREWERALRLSPRHLKRSPELERLGRIDKALEGWSAERARQALEEIVARRVVFWSAHREPHETIPHLIFDDAEGPRGFRSTQYGPGEWADVQGIKLIWPCYPGQTDPAPFKYEAIWFPQGCTITISLGPGPTHYGELGLISAIPNEERESGKQLARALLNDPTLDIDFKLSLFRGGLDTKLYESASGIIELNTWEDEGAIRGYLLVRESGKRVDLVQESASGRVLSPSGEVLYEPAAEPQPRRHRLWPWTKREQGRRT